MRTLALATAVAAIAGLSGCSDDRAAPVNPDAVRTSADRSVTIEDPKGDVANPSVDIVSGALERTGGVVRITLHLAAPPAAGQSAAYGAVVQRDKDSWLAVAQISGGAPRYRLVPMDGSPGPDVRGSVRGSEVVVEVPESMLPGTGDIAASLHAEDNAGDPSKDAAPDDGWPGPRRVTIPAP